MTLGTIYLFASLCALIGMFYLWFFGFRRLYLDVFRDDLFTIRFELFAIADSGAVDFNDAAYRKLELLINALIRYGHRVSFFTYMLASQHVEDQKKHDYRAFHDLFLSHVNCLNPEVQDQLLSLLPRINSAVAEHMRRSSLVFRVTSWCLWLGIFRSAFTGRDATMQKVYVFESEAYDSYLTQTKNIA